jgi:hypothetical protein
MKYHDKRDKIVTIEVDMTGARKCHKNMHRAINTATKEQQEKATQNTNKTRARFFVFFVFVLHFESFPE